ncbi:hypothetical protein MOX02_33200 [Methylobacterium oxalidis]|uniref:Uncharacterized protein n=2 Tax=Methylobacterium oxalidis TaxID=944322 RepID=A0A512J5U9_9HYPH|nr:hypothetical protein MOX02_33200 [Methylobacterium oxalidis]GJE29981.1 hypothetical protein LDDCCGHA_0144 [Methylobacterium oxalidis]GLS64674.1 hypothetical protein GCM10007888_30550 [Methylobacterium oxalidis]
MSKGFKPRPEQLETVAELTTRLAEQAMAEMMSRRPVSEETVRSLADGVLILDENAHPIPRLALDVLMRIHRERASGSLPTDPDAGSVPAPETDADERSEVLSAGHKVLRLFRSFRPRSGR